jgi:hypothetical protein
MAAVEASMQPSWDGIKALVNRAQAKFGSSTQHVASKTGTLTLTLAEEFFDDKDTDSAELWRAFLSSSSKASAQRQQLGIELGVPTKGDKLKQQIFFSASAAAVDHEDNEVRGVAEHKLPRRYDSRGGCMDGDNSSAAVG